MEHCKTSQILTSVFRGFILDKANRCLYLSKSVFPSAHHIDNLDQLCVPGHERAYPTSRVSKYFSSTLHHKSLTPGKSESRWSLHGDKVSNCRIAFLIIYTGEMIVKVLAMGLIMDPYTYLRSPWNWLDFLVIVSSFLTSVIGSLAPLRALRVLRALKTISIVPGQSERNRNPILNCVC